MSNQDKNIKTVLGIYQNKESFNKDTFIRLELSSKTNLVKPDKNIFVLNLLDQFDLERNTSNCYRINGKLQVITSNTFYTGWFTVPTSMDWDPIPLDEDLIGLNWVLQITYPYSIDDTKEMTNKTLTGTKVSVVNRGVQLDSITEINITGRRPQSLLRTVQRHGVSDIGEYVYIKPDSTNGPEYLGFHRVIDFEVGNEEYGLVLSTPYTTNILQGVVKRVFEPSLEDVSFINTNNVDEITATDETGLSVGAVGQGYTKIYDVNHSLRLSDFIDIRFSQASPMDGLYKVVSIPNSDEFIIQHNLNTNNTGIIDITSIIPALTLSYRLISGTPSEYYFRKFKVLTNLKDYEVYNAGYSKNVFSDGISNDVDQFHFNKDIDVSGLVDNLGRPLTELYLTITKRASNGGNTNNAFKGWGSVVSTLEENRSIVPYNNSNITIETVSWWVNTPSNVNGSVANSDLGDIMYGDLVEYNRAFLKETVLSKTIHRFAPGRLLLDAQGNTTGGFDSGVGEGYYYFPNNKIQIRKFSDVIETSVNKSDQTFPDYSQINPEGTVSWRDLLGIGFFEAGTNGVDHPFVNGCNYIYNNYSIYIRRQRPADAIDINIEDATTFVKIDPNNIQNNC